MKHHPTFHALIAALVLATVSCSREPAPGPVGETPQIPVVLETGYDFLERLDEAAVTAEAENLVHPEFAPIGGVYRWSIFQHPASSIEYRDVYVGENAKLTFSIGIKEEAWGEDGDGALFRLTARPPDGGGETVLFEKYIDPKNKPDDRRWHGHETALDGFAGKRVDFAFETLPGEDPETDLNYFDWAMWAGPELTSDGRADARTEHGKPNLLLITLDTTRVDYLGCYGNPWIDTRNLDGLAENGVRFVNAFSASHQTVPSHASMFTGMLPYTHGSMNQDYRLHPDAPRLTRVLKKHGYRTGAAVSSDVLNQYVTGLGGGFDAYDQPEGGIIQLAGLTRSARATTNAAIRIMESFRNEPLFLWVHYFDPHTPYVPEGEFNGMYYEGDPTGPGFASMEGALFPAPWFEMNRWWVEGVRDLEYFKRQYAAEITYMDREIGRLYGALKRLGMDQTTVSVITADHGESLGEHGVYLDHHTLFKQEIHVPLIVHGPGAVPEGKTVETPVSGTDIAALFCDAAGIGEGDAAPFLIEGRNPAPLWKAPEGESQTEWPRRVLTAQAYLYLQTAGWANRYKVVWELRDNEYHEGFKLEPGRVEVYDRANDPEELSPVAAFYLREIDEDKTIAAGEAPHVFPEGQKVRHMDAMAAAIRAAKTVIPTADGLRARLADPGENEFILEEYKDGAVDGPGMVSIYDETVEILNHLQAQLIPPSILERAGAEDWAAPDGGGMEGRPVVDEDVMAKLRALGYNQ